MPKYKLKRKTYGLMNFISKNPKMSMLGVGALGATAMAGKSVLDKVTGEYAEK